MVQQRVEAATCEIRTFIVDGEPKHMLYTRFLAPSEEGRFNRFERRERPEVVEKWFGGDEAALAHAEQQILKLARRWVLWFRTQSATLPPCFRLDCFVVRRPVNGVSMANAASFPSLGGGGAVPAKGAEDADDDDDNCQHKCSIYTGELTELGASMLGWADGVATTFPAVIRSCFTDVDCAALDQLTAGDHKSVCGEDAHGRGVVLPGGSSGWTGVDGEYAPKRVASATAASCGCMCGRLDAISVGPRHKKLGAGQGGGGAKKDLGAGSPFGGVVTYIPRDAKQQQATVGASGQAHQQRQEDRQAQREQEHKRQHAAAKAEAAARANPLASALLTQADVDAASSARAELVHAEQARSRAASGGGGGGGGAAAQTPQSPSASRNARKRAKKAEAKAKAAMEAAQGTAVADSSDAAAVTEAAAAPPAAPAGDSGKKKKKRNKKK
jgi:hypothetical protein